MTKVDTNFPELSSGGNGILPVSAVVLAGGMGKRMGGNKLFLAFNGSLILERVLWRLSGWFKEIIIVVGPDDKDPLENILDPVKNHLNLKVVVDKNPGRGPLEGLATSLENISTEWAFVVGCDMPGINEAVLRTMWQAKQEESAIICARINGYVEPLHAFYRSVCLQAIRKKLASGNRKLTSFYEDTNVMKIHEDALSLLPGYRNSFKSVNTPEELKNFFSPLIP